MTPTARERLFYSACAGIFVFGIVLALLGTLFGLPEMRERLDLTLPRQGNVFLLLYLGLLIATLVVGPTIDRFGSRVTLVAGAGLVAASLVGFAMVHSFPGAAVSALALGLGGGALNTTTNVLVSDLFGDSRGPRLNILGIFFGFGALFIPLLAASLSAWFSIPQMLFFAATLAGACTAAYLVLAFPQAREAASFSMAEAIGVARHPGVLLFGFLLFFQSGNEAAIAGWTSTYTGARGWDPRTSTWLLAGYWAALICGRLLAARLLRRAEKSRVVLASGAGSVLGCVILLSATSLPVLAIGVAVIGLAFAPVFPTTLALVGDRYPRFAGTVFGLLFSIALVGGMTFPWGVGHVAEAFGVRAGMVLPLVGAAMITGLAAVIATRNRADVEPAAR
jgi:MFS transporter, FHS family, glucose/mannose:H+ symporter